MPNTRYFKPGTTKVYFVPTIASATLIATAAEVIAGSSLNGTTTVPLLADLEGFTYANAPIDVPDWTDTFVGKVPGRDQSVDSTLHFYDWTTTNTLRTTLAKGTTGYIVIFNAGLAGATPAAGDKADVWPIISTGPAKDYSATEAAKWHVGIAASARPALDVTLT